MVNEQYERIIVGLMIFSLLVSINLSGRRRLKKYTEIQNGITAQQFYFLKNSNIRFNLKLKFQKGAYQKIFAPFKNKIFLIH